MYICNLIDLLNSMLFFLFFLFMCESVLLSSCNLFSFNAWLPGSTSPYGYSRQPVLLLHLIFLCVVIFSCKYKSTLKVVVVVIYWYYCTRDEHFMAHYLEWRLNLFLLIYIALIVDRVIKLPQAKWVRRSLEMYPIDMVSTGDIQRVCVVYDRTSQFHYFYKENVTMIDIV